MLEELLLQILIEVQNMENKETQDKIEEVVEEVQEEIKEPKPRFQKLKMHQYG